MVWSSREWRSSDHTPPAAGEGGEPAEETIGGYVAARLGREVVPGDRTQLGDLSISVLDAERYRVRWVMVQTQMPKTEEAEESESEALS